MSKGNNTMETQDKNYFNVEVFGDYFVAGSEGNIIRSFGFITLKMRVWDNCQNLSRFHIIPNLLREADPEFQNMRKCVVTKVSTSDGEPVYNIPLAFMSREDIAKEVKSNKIPLRCDMCNDIIELRKKLRFARSNPVEFAKQESKRIKSYSKIDDAMVLNKDVFAKIRERGKELLAGKIKLPKDAVISDEDYKCALEERNKEQKKADASLAELPKHFRPTETQIKQRTADAERVDVEAGLTLPPVQVENPNENKEVDEKDAFDL